MSDSSNPSSAQPSSEVVRWLQSLALPLWARGVLVIVFLAVMLGGLGLVVWAVFNRDKESMTAAISLLTVALPVSLIVIGLVFGQRSEKRLANITIPFSISSFLSKYKKLPASHESSSSHHFCARDAERPTH